MARSTDPRIIAIRSDARVGRGTCTSIDECFDDSELIELLDSAGISDPAAAVKHAQWAEGLRIEQALNHRWGEDTDPELRRYEEWHDQA